MTYPQAIAYLDSLIDYERRPLPEQARMWNLDRTRMLLNAVGNPHQGLRVAHIAGTKGKGSTCVFIASILRAAGYRVGLWTKPHLVDFRERIRLDGICIPKRDVTRLVVRLMPHVERLKKTLPFPPSFFEVYTALALLWFAEKEVDVAVLETGLGGRLDATNVVTPLVSIITTIGLDHTVELGPTISHIAREKAGIIKPGIPVISAPQRREAFREIVRASRQHNAPLYCLAPLAPVAAGPWAKPGPRPFGPGGFSLRTCRAGVPALSEVEGPTPAASVHSLLPSAWHIPPPPLWGRVGVRGDSAGQSASPPTGGRIASCPGSPPGQRFSFTGLDGKTRRFHIPLLGSPQIINASLACACAQLLGVPISAIRIGLASARWPGRFHVIPGDPTRGERSRTTIVLDCAHDGISAVALARDIRATFPGREVILVLGISRDKDAVAVIRPLCRIAKQVITTASTLPRAADPADLARLIQPTRPVEPIPTVPAALHRAISLAAQPVGRARLRPPQSGHSERPVPRSLGEAGSEESHYAQGKLREESHLVLVTGSVYVVGEAMEALRINPCDLPI